MLGVRRRVSFQGNGIESTIEGKIENVKTGCHIQNTVLTCRKSRRLSFRFRQTYLTKFCNVTIILLILLMLSFIFSYPLSQTKLCIITMVHNHHQSLSPKPILLFSYNNDTKLWHSHYSNIAYCSVPVLS